MLLGVLNHAPREVINLNFNSNSLLNTGVYRNALPSSLSPGSFIDISGGRYNLPGTSGRTFGGISTSAVYTRSFLAYNFDLSFVLSVTANASGRIISFDDNGSGETNLQLDFVASSGLVFRSSSGNGYFPTVSMSSVFPITIGTEYSCLIKIRDNLLEFIVNGITRISHTLVTPYYNSNKKLDFGGFGTTDAIYGYMDNIKLTLLYK